MSEGEGGAGQIAALGGSGQRDGAGGETPGAAGSLSSPSPKAPTNGLRTLGSKRLCYRCTIRIVIPPGRGGVTPPCLPLPPRHPGQRWRATVTPCSWPWPCSPCCSWPWAKPRTGAPRHPHPHLGSRSRSGWRPSLSPPWSGVSCLLDS